MGGALPRGSIAYDEVVPTEHIRVGDVITYRPPNSDRQLTHRVVWIGKGRHGVRTYRTRGDASPAPDRRAFLLPNDGQARVAFHVPLAGYVLAALSVREERMAGIGGAGLAGSLAAVAGIPPGGGHPRHRTAGGVLGVGVGPRRGSASTPP